MRYEKGSDRDTAKVLIGGLFIMRLMILGAWNTMRDNPRASFAEKCGIGLLGLGLLILPLIVYCSAVHCLKWGVFAQASASNQGEGHGHSADSSSPGVVV